MFKQHAKDDNEEKNNSACVTKYYDGFYHFLSEFSKQGSGAKAYTLILAFPAILYLYVKGTLAQCIILLFHNFCPLVSYIVISIDSPLLNHIIVKL